MLDPKADGKWLWVKMDLALLQHAKYIPRAVSGREYYVTAVHSLAARERYAFDLARFEEKIGDFAFKAHFAAKRADLLAHGRHDTRESECSDVWLTDIEDFRRRAGAHEFMHDLAAKELWIFDLAVEFAVREQSRATLAELYIGLRRELALPPQGPRVTRSASEHPVRVQAQSA